MNALCIEGINSGITDNPGLFIANRQYWGELGYFRILMGHNCLGIEMEVAWANPGSFTVNNYPCYENGENCVKTVHYKDPPHDIDAVKLRLANERKIKHNIRG